MEREKAHAKTPTKLKGHITINFDAHGNIYIYIYQFENSGEELKSRFRV